MGKNDKKGGDKAGGKGKGGGGGDKDAGKAKGAQSINVRHILVSSLSYYDDAVFCGCE